MVVLSGVTPMVRDFGCHRYRRFDKSFDKSDAALSIL